MPARPEREQVAEGPHAIAMPNSGTFSATLRPFLKTPEPMTVPTTIAVAIHGPSTRGRD